ncbi:hypothetical protein DL765_001047 [Monosporascus sp. GIB2]|nr:hypothetical protein DL765_001047 [Monosporascus sp. GIB2]
MAEILVNNPGGGFWARNRALIESAYADAGLATDETTYFGLMGQVPTYQTTPVANTGLRRASANSFGYDGTNAHYIFDDAYHFLRGRGVSEQHSTTAINTVQGIRLESDTLSTTNREWWSSMFDVTLFSADRSEIDSKAVFESTDLSGSNPSPQPQLLAEVLQGDPAPSRGGRPSQRMGLLPINYTWSLEWRKMAAAFTKGAISRETAWTISYHPERLSATLSRTGAVLAVALGEQDVQAFVDQATADPKPAIIEDDMLRSSQYFVDNLVCPVKFKYALEEALNSDSPTSDATVIMEIGPHGALQGPIKQIVAALELKPQNIDSISLLMREEDAVKASLVAAGMLYQRGYPVDICKANVVDSEDLPAPLVNLLPYTWNHKSRYWYATNSHPTANPVGETVSASRKSLGEHYMICGQPVLSCSTMLAMVFEANRETADPARTIEAIHFLDVFICMFSAAGQIGSIAQSNYNADAIMHHRRSLGLRGTSINLGWMSDVGFMAERGKVPEIVRAGAPRLSEEHFLAIVEAAMAGQVETQLVLCLASGGLVKANGFDNPYWFSDARFGPLRMYDPTKAQHLRIAEPSGWDR